MRLMDVDNYCENICLCNRDQCDKEKCSVFLAPAVDAVPVTHGRYHRKHIGNGWDDWDALTCSVCGKYYEKPNFPTNYCPNCGAMMNKGGGNAGV